MKPPLVSVVMPMYNTAPYVAAAVQSILDQTHDDFEFIILDDGSTDGGVERIDQLAAGDDRIRLYRRDHGGHTRLLNEGIQLARGELIARMDADDIAEPNRFALQARYLTSHPECVALGGQALLIDQDGDPIAPLGAPLEHDEIEQELFTGRGSALIHPAAMFRKDALLSVGGYCERYMTGQDLDLYLRLSEIGRLANLPERLLRFRRHLGSVTAFNQTEQADQQARDVVAAARRRRGMTSTEVPLRRFFQPRSPVDLYARWAVMAIGAGHHATARKYAGRVLRTKPLSLRTWFHLATIGARAVLAALPDWFTVQWRAWRGRRQQLGG